MTNNYITALKISQIIEQWLHENEDEQEHAEEDTYIPEVFRLGSSGDSE